VESHIIKDGRTKKVIFPSLKKYLSWLVKGSSVACCIPDSLSPRKLIDLGRGWVARDKDDSEEIESIETTEEGVVDMGEMERSLAQEMICGVMISKKSGHSSVPQASLYHVTPTAPTDRTITTRLSQIT
jgi:hypothetical protein